MFIPPPRRHDSGRRDLNSRPPEPHSGALPNYATPRNAAWWRETPFHAPHGVIIQVAPHGQHRRGIDAMLFLKASSGALRPRFARHHRSAQSKAAANYATPRYLVAAWHPICLAHSSNGSVVGALRPRSPQKRWPLARDPFADSSEGSVASSAPGPPVTIAGAGTPRNNGGCGKVL